MDFADPGAWTFLGPRHKSGQVLQARVVELEELLSKCSCRGEGVEGVKIGTCGDASNSDTGSCPGSGPEEVDK